MRLSRQKYGGRLSSVLSRRRSPRSLSTATQQRMTPSLPWHLAPLVALSSRMPRLVCSCASSDDSIPPHDPNIRFAVAANELEAAVTALLMGLCKAVASDGEGATCLLEVCAEHALTLYPGLLAICLNDCHSVRSRFLVLATCHVHRKLPSRSLGLTCLRCCATGHVTFSL